MQVMLAILVLLNGQAIKFPDAAPMKEEARVLIPLRGVFEAMGAEVNYDSQVRSIKILQANYEEKNEIELAVDRQHAWVNGNELALDAPVRLRKGRVYVPLRFIAEALGAQVNWDRATNTVAIRTEEVTTKKLPKPSIRAGEIEVQAQADRKTYQVGETVEISIVAQNQDERAKEVTYNSGQSFDVTITPLGESSPRWTWSHGRMFTMALRSKTLAPGERVTFSAQWDQKDNEGNPVPPGKYTIETVLTANGGIKAAPFQITIE